MEKNKEKISKVVKTYVDDMAKVIENDKGGLIRKIIHGEEEHEAEKINLSPESRKNEIIMLLGLLFVLAGLITLFFFFYKRPATVSVQRQFVPIIFTDKSFLIEINGLKKDEIPKKVLTEINTTKVKENGLEGIYLTFDGSLVGLRQFITSIGSTFSPGDAKFVDDNFLMGVINSRLKALASEVPVSTATTPNPPATTNPDTNKNTTPNNPVSSLRDKPMPPSSKDFFILLKMRSVADIFDGLQAWENKMFAELHGFLGIDFSSDTKYLLTKNFEDGIVENKNARILYDKDNKIVLMYVLADDNSVIITDSQSATHEIMLRLASGQVKK